jgi:SAM-dependent methyltransferase
LYGARLAPASVPPPRFPTRPAVRGFDRLAEAYERVRPGYPASAVRHLGLVFHLGPGRTVVDVGSGTGKFTRALAPLGAARIAVEPTKGMRRVFARVVPEVPVLDGTAEAIPLPGGFADAIVCAQAFHWFRPRTTLKEFARVLRPGGGVGLVWNTREARISWSRRISAIADRYHRKERTRTGWEPWKRAFGDARSPFGPLHFRSFPSVQRAPAETHVARILSVSSVAVQPAAERRRVAREVREILRTDPLTRGKRLLTLPMRTEVYWAFVK